MNHTDSWYDSKGDKDYSFPNNGTVDLFSKTLLNNSEIVYALPSSPDSNECDNEKYSGCNLDNYLSGTVYNGFANEVKNIMRQYAYYEYKTHYTATIGYKYVIAPDLIDIRGDSYGYPELHSISRTGNQSNNRNLIIFQKPSGEDHSYWLRSVYGSINNLACCVNTTDRYGWLYEENGTYTCGVVAKIRIGR